MIGVLVIGVIGAPAGISAPAARGDLAPPARTDIGAVNGSVNTPFADRCPDTSTSCARDGRLQIWLVGNTAREHVVQV